MAVGKLFVTCGWPGAGLSRILLEGSGMVFLAKVSCADLGRVPTTRKRTASPATTWKTFQFEILIVVFDMPPGKWRRSAGTSFFRPSPSGSSQRLGIISRDFRLSLPVATDCTPRCPVSSLGWRFFLPGAWLLRERRSSRFGGRTRRRRHFAVQRQRVCLGRKDGSPPPGVTRHSVRARRSILRDSQASDDLRKAE